MLGPGSFLLKIHRYDGSDSILRTFDNEDDANTERDALNVKEQTDQYYVEPFDKDKLKTWPRHGRRNRIAALESHGAQ